jgi:hypothetical protein
MDLSDRDCDMRKRPRDLLGREVNMHTVLVGTAMVGEVYLSDLVAIDEDGSIWHLATGPRPKLVERCFEKYLRWHPEIGSLCRSLNEGHTLHLPSQIAHQHAVPWKGRPDAKRNAAPVRSRTRTNQILPTLDPWSDV